MKLLLSLVLPLMTHSAFAAGYDCAKQISKTVKSTATIYVDQTFYVFAATEDCSHGCQYTEFSDIVEDYQVCSQSIDAHNNCKVTSGNYHGVDRIEILCNDTTRFVFVMDSTNTGRMGCFKNGVLQKSWDVGTCQSY